MAELLPILRRFPGTHVPSSQQVIVVLRGYWEITPTSSGLKYVSRDLCLSLGDGRLLMRTADGRIVTQAESEEIEIKDKDRELIGDIFEDRYSPLGQ